MTLRNLPRTSGVYRIVNVVTGKVYIGSAERLYTRAHCHFSMLRNAKHFNAHLQAAWAVDGAAAFRFEVIETVPTSALREREQFHIDAADACNPTLGYNRAESVRVALTNEQRTLLATCKAGRVVSEETKKKIAATLTGRKLGPQSEDHKRKKNSALKGRKRSAETRQRIKDARARQDPASLSHPHNEESRVRMSAAAKRRCAAAIQVARSAA